MSNEALLAQAPSSETRSLWSTLTGWWSPVTTPAEAELGYESAHPWTLGEDTAREVGGESLYY